jgi:hypothetical protein
MGRVTTALTEPAGQIPDAGLGVMLLADTSSPGVKPIPVAVPGGVIVTGHARVLV